MRLPVHRLLAVFLLLLMQGPALLVQELAWVRMLVTYSCDRGLARGVVETFDGHHPCPMCVKAAKLREEERKPDPAGQVPPALKRMVWTEAVFPRVFRLRPPKSADCDPAEFLSYPTRQGIGRRAPVPPPPERVLG